MKKTIFLSIVMAMAFMMTLADSRETVVVNGSNVDNTATRLTFSGDEVTLTYEDGSTQTADLSTVSISFNHVAVFKASGNDNLGTIKTYGGRTLPAEVTLSLVAGQWSTLCLPFDVPSSSLPTLFGTGTVVATLNGSTAEGIDFVTVDKIVKGMPYLIKPGQDVTSFTLDNVTIGTMGEGSTVSSDPYLFTGNIESLSATLTGAGTGILMGDVNNDGQVNVSDVTLVVNHILNNGSSINTELGDMDHSGDITISDVTLLVNAILTNSGSSATQPAILIDGEDIGLKPSDLQ